MYIENSGNYSLHQQNVLSKNKKKKKIMLLEKIVHIDTAQCSNFPLGFYYEIRFVFRLQSVFNLHRKLEMIKFSL